LAGTGLWPLKVCPGKNKTAIGYSLQNQLGEYRNGKDFSPQGGYFHWQLPIVSPRVETEMGRFVRKTFLALDLSDSETGFESLVLHSSLLSARR